MSLYDDYANGSSSSSGLYGSYQAPKSAAPVKAPQQDTSVHFGNIAHSFLSGLAHAAAHPIQTAKDVGKGFVDSAVNDAKTVASFVPNAAVGTYHTVAAGVDALKGDKQAALKQLDAANATYNNSYIGKTYGSKFKGDTSGLGNAGGFAVDAAGLKGGGALIKEGVKGAAEQGLKGALVKGAAKGAAGGAAQGAAYGVAGAAQQNDLSAGNIERNAAAGAATGLLAGGILGGVTHGTGVVLNKALHGWANLAAETAHPDAHVEGPKLLEAGAKPLALPAGVKSAGSLPAESVTAPIKTTAGPNGGKFGDFNTVSPETANKITALNHTISNFHSDGTKAEDIHSLGSLSAMRANAAQVVDSIAVDRAKANVSEGGNYKELLDEAHRDLATAKDPQALHYQQATEVAKAADQAYQEKVAHVSTKQTDLYGPRVSADKAAAAKAALSEAEAQAGQERIGEVHPHASVNEPQAPVPDLIKQLNAAEKGESAVSQLSILNKLIEHRDIDTEHKQAWIEQRDALLPSNKGKEVGTPVSLPAEPAPKPAAAVAHDVTADDLKTQVPKAPKEFVPSTGEVGHASDVTKPGGGFVERAVRKVVGSKGSGLINPSRAASREGNVGFSRAATNLVSSKRQRTYLAKSAAGELKGLMKGVSHDDVIAAIEGAPPKNDKVAAAAAFFQAHRDAIGGESKVAGTIKGQKDNYLPHIARGLESRKGGGANGLKKNTRYNIERQSVEHLNQHGEVVKEDKYKTIGEFEAAIKKIDPKASAERDVTKILEHMLITEGHAVENARTVEKLMDTRMQDGRPVLARTTEANLKDQKYNGYSVLDNKMVHPDAKNLYEAITKTGKIDNPFGEALVKANVATKRLVTINGMVHALNIWKSSYAAQGASRAIWAIGSRGASKEEYVRALGYGAKFARASNDNLFDEVGKQVGLLGKFEKATDPLTHALFHGFGDRQGMSTYKYIEGKLLKKGLTQDEAGRIAADGANQVMHFVPEDQQSIVVRQSSQIALFAGQFLQNTLKTATNAVGVGLDRTLSKEGQRAAQKLAVTRIARMFAYSFASAQAINLAATGKYTWENGNGDPLNPIWYQTKDAKGNVKSYRITNHYGQLKDIAGFVMDPFHELQNKLAPGARELVSQVSNTDLFTSDKIADEKTGEATQLIDRMVHAASNMFTPAGINLASPSKQPAVVQGAKYLGINSSSVKPNDKTDYAKLATDKASAKSLIDAYSKGDNSKLAAMQALKASGNSYFDKFFAANPSLDPTSKDFAGFKANNSKEVAAGIKEGFDTAKANGQTLPYMQSIKESGSTYFDKFFAEHPDLDPTSEQFAGSSKNSNSRQKSEAKYLAKGAKYAGSNFIKAKGTVKTTAKGRSARANIKSAPIKYKAPKAPRVVGGGLTRRSKKIGI